MIIVYLTGLPRSGSTLLCNLLAQHPDITATPSSPLCHLIQSLRRTWSDDHFLLSQLDDDFGNVYARLERSTKAFMEAWSESETPLVIDKNRGWLAAVETLRALYPDFKMIVTLRDLQDVYASVEKRHRQTILLDFPDHMENNIIDGRANALFTEQGVIGSALRALNNLSDVPDILSHIYFWRFEDFLAKPKEGMRLLTEWLGVSPYVYELDNIEQKTHESDSYHRMKYPHTVSKWLTPPKNVPISPRIAKEIRNRFHWYYQQYYPTIEVQNPKNSEPLSETEARIAKEITEAL